MKKFALVIITALVSIGCNGQNDKNALAQSQEIEDSIGDQPLGSWKVNREYDERGNLIRYDSIYSWSSDGKIDKLSNIDRDSLLNSFKSRFYSNFSAFDDQGFESLFSKDSLFINKYFNDGFFESSFGQDYMDLDKLTQRIIERQRKFLEKYEGDFSKSEP